MASSTLNTRRTYSLCFIMFNSFVVSKVVVGTCKNDRSSRDCCCRTVSQTTRRRLVAAVVATSREWRKDDRESHVRVG